jgi:hypothetical protein
MPTTTQLKPVCSSKHKPVRTARNFMTTDILCVALTAYYVQRWQTEKYQAVLLETVDVVACLVVRVRFFP